MPSYKIIKLRNLTPLHVGTGKENYDFSASELQSDTLTAALAAIRIQSGNATDVSGFLNSFSLSSAFPFTGERIFLPKMQGKIPMVEDKSEARKRLKKVRYIEKEIWCEMIQGKVVKTTDEQFNGDYLTSSEKLKDFHVKSVHQRVFVPREDNDKTEPFFFEWNFFHPDSGLFVIVDSDESLFVEIRNLFKALGEIGLGTDKNIGGGKFDIEVDELHLPDVKDANHTMLLSLYIPTEDEFSKLNLPESKFNLSLRGGFMAGSSEEKLRHLRKKSIYMFGVGTLFPIIIPLHGKVVDLRPDWNDERMHSVYKSGKPFYLPVKL